jgi:hypothetical protein
MGAPEPEQAMKILAKNWGQKMRTQEIMEDG